MDAQELLLPQLPEARRNVILTLTVTMDLEQCQESESGTAASQVKASPLLQIKNDD